MTINPNDIEIYTYNTGSGWFVRNNGVTLRHKSTGIEASSSTEVKDLASIPSFFYFLNN